MIRSILNTSFNKDNIKTEKEYLFFNENNILTGNSISHIEGSNIITFANPGYYFVSFQSDIVSESIELATISILNEDNNIINNATTTFDLTIANILNISLNTIVKVLPLTSSTYNKNSIIKIIVESDNKDLTFTNGKLNIIKIPC